jgi:hypothetical protein
MGLFKCEKCRKYGLVFDRDYAPDQFLEGKPDSLIWIVGLNPKGNKKNTNSTEGAEDLQRHFDDKSKIHPYFRDFKKASSLLYDSLGKSKGAAHTDLVKCFSTKFPPENCKWRDAEKIIKNCQPYLEVQIKKHKPRMLICNGASVCRTIQEMFPPAGEKTEEITTAYITRVEGDDIGIILSGFIGRIDNYAKARLGKEIENYAEQLNILW